MASSSTAYQSDILEVVGKIIDIINAGPNLPKMPDDPGQPQTTIFERAFNLFIEKGQSGVSYRELETLIRNFAEVADIAKGVSKLMSRLRAKLLEYDYTIVSYKLKDHSLYYIIIRLPGE